MPDASFSFEWGVGVLLWLHDAEDVTEWGNPVGENDLPVSAELRDELTRLVEWHDHAVNWRYPPDPGPWRQDECDRFNRAASEALRRLRDELGPTWDIVRDVADTREDPDLDRYLAGPRGFDRPPMT